LPLWLYWVLLGLIAGSLAKFLLPGRDPSGCIFTVLLGLAGAMLGGVIGTHLGFGRVTQGSFDVRSVAIATLGSILLLVAGRLARRGWSGRG
jgi:uncharacterized membrane protein YeaQ/YmgE (transglycosylase-associated protein family)